MTLTRQLQMMQRYCGVLCEHHVNMLMLVNVLFGL